MSSDRCFALVSPSSSVIPNNLECGTNLVMLPSKVRLGKGPVNLFLLRIIPSHFLGCGTKKLTAEGLFELKYDLIHLIIDAIDC